MMTGNYYRAVVSGQARGFWPALERLGLWAASVPYGWTTKLRNRLYDLGWKRSYRLSVPVVSVGNLTLGGTGKTPCVEYIARFYRQRGLRVALLSRGYGNQGGRNDEALVLEQNLPDVPHLQGADRPALARRAVTELESQVLVLDDGFQHRRLARDLDLVLVDATEPWGHGRLFPRGLLREAPERLSQASVILLTRCDQVGEEDKKRLRREVACYAGLVPVVETVHRPLEWVNSERDTAPLGMTAQRPVIAFCGIGNPDAFHRSLLALGVKPAAFRTFPDHHAYTQADVIDLGNWARQREGIIATTQKDLVKLRLARLGDRELWALRIGLHVEAGQDLLQTQLLDVLRPERSPAGRG